MKNIFGVLIGLVLTASVLAQINDTLPDSTGIVATDINGKTWNIDSLLTAGKHIWVHQTWAG